MKITITHTASKIGISQGYLSRILNGTRRPSPDLAFKISKLTDTSLEIWLFNTPENLISRKASIKQAKFNQRGGIMDQTMSNNLTKTPDEAA